MLDDGQVIHQDIVLTSLDSLRDLCHTKQQPDCYLAGVQGACPRNVVVPCPCPGLDRRWSQGGS